MTFARRKESRAFTLMELLVVIAIIAVLIGILMPMFSRARAQANLISCMSRERQLVTILINYAQSNRSHFPPNMASPSPGRYWCDSERLGIPAESTDVPNVPGKYYGTSVSCPSDRFFGRTYAMNIWASSSVDSTVTASIKKLNLASLWSYCVRRPSSMLLLSESWSSGAITNPATKSTVYVASPAIGYGPVTGYTGPAQRFGYNGGFPSPTLQGPWGYVNCDLAFVLHRLSSGATNTNAPGCVNIGFADGHVSSQRPSDLVNAAGQLTGVAYWSPVDFEGQ